MRLVFWLIQWTWGLVQNVLGALLTLALIRRPRTRFLGAVVTHWPLWGSMSLGMFLFLGRDEQSVLVHEFGHAVQSCILGPLYLPVVGLPSLLWATLPVCRRLRTRRHISYYAMYQEAWANHLGQRATGLPAPESNARQHRKDRL